MVRSISLCRYLFLSLIAGALCWPQELPDSNRQILDRLDRLEKQNAELLEQIKALREQVAAAKPAEADETKERVAVNEHRVAELAQVKVEASQRFPIQLTGMALFNAYTNGRYGGDAEDPVVAVLNRDSSESGATFRQSIVGVTFQGPKIFGGGAVSGSVLLDLFAGASPYQQQLLRLRVATVQVDWAHTTFAIARDKPLISRRDPNSLAQVGVSPLTGAGNPWLWQPQARMEQRVPLTAKTTLSAAAGIFETAEPSADNVAVEEARPAFESRVAVSHRFSDERSFELAGVFHTSTSHAAGVPLASRLYGVDWMLKPRSYLEFSGLLFRGQNFSNLGALGGISFPAGGPPLAIHGSGGWAQLRLMPTQKLAFDFYGGQQDDRNRDLEQGGIGKNQYYAANVMYYLGQNVLTSFEVGHVITSYLGNGNRAANHYDLAIAYLF